MPDPALEAIERRYQEERAKQAIGQAQFGKQVYEEIESMKTQITPETLQQLRNEIKNTTTMGLGLECQKDKIEMEVSRRLTELLYPDALQRVAQRIITTKQNPERNTPTIDERLDTLLKSTKQDTQQQLGNRAQIEKRLEELVEIIPQLRHARDVVKIHAKQDLSDLLNFPNELTVLSSVITSWDSIAEILNQSGYVVPAFEPLPQDKAPRMTWIQRMIQGQILTDQELDTQAQKIRSYLSRL